MSQKRKLAITLGPYRNLTTLTAAVLALHPDIQVLNHAAERFWVPGNDLDFLASPDPAIFDRFMEAGWALSAAGERGSLGGSILHSHAYDSDRMKALYRDRHGEARLKANARWLLWKESMRVQRRLMESPDLFDRICDSFPDVRFILPLRNPLDCAASNRATGHYIRTLQLAEGASVEVVLEAVLEAFAWALERREKRPDRIFAFTQNGKPREVFRALAAFLDIEAGGRWLDDAAAAFVVRMKYRHSPAAIAHARAKTMTHLGRWPEYAAALV